MNKLDLVSIVTSEEFLTSLDKAARMSHRYKKESAFLVYTLENFYGIYVNQPILGKTKTSELAVALKLKKTEYGVVEGGHEKEPAKGFGFFSPDRSYRILRIHFHPPNSDLCPSYVDFRGSFNMAGENLNLIESSDEFHVDTQEDEDHEEKLPRESKAEYINPVDMIGLVRNDPSKIELLVYQLTNIEEDFDAETELTGFNEYVGDYLNRKYRTKYFDPTPSLLLDMTGFPLRFKRTEKILEFLNSSRYFHAESINVNNGVLSKKDLEKLKKFKLKHTMFFNGDGL